MSKKRILAIVLATTLALSLGLAPAALAWQEGSGTDWWYVDASYGDYHTSVPLEIKLNGDSSAGQTFIVGDTITISGELHAVAQSCGGDGNGAYTEWHLEVDGPSGPDSTSDSNYDSSSGCAVADEDTTLTITYDLTTTGTHTVYMSSYAAVSQYWTDVADDFVDASLTFEVEFFSVPLCAGQHIDVGTVTVWDDGTDLYVEYETTDGWLMTETHLAVENGEANIPQTKKGNPIPGHFTYSMEHDPPVPDYTYTITLPAGPLYIAAHAVVQKVNVITEAPYYAASFDDYWQGTLNNGNPIPASWNRSNPAAVLALNEPLWFFSLGFGEPDNGWIIVEFDCPIRNGDGNDVQVLEVTNASPCPSETANVSASQDGSLWILLGQADNSDQAYPVGLTASEFDLGPLPWAKYIKVENTTDPIDHQGIVSDAFDLEAVVSLQDCIEIMEETAWGDGCEGERFVERGNWATFFEYTVTE